MENNGYNKPEAQKKGLWGIIDSIEGDKVIWIIVLLLILISVLAIFSSTPLLSDETRIEIMKSHGGVAVGGLIMIILMYKFINKIGIYRFFSRFGFFITLVLLLILDFHMNLGFIRAQHINGAWRTLSLLGFQIHVFEIAKVAMVMYLAWALHAYKQDCEAMEEGRESSTFSLANSLALHPRLAFMKKPLAKRCLYIYGPSLLICGLVAPGSNSSAIFIALVLIGTMLIGGISLPEASS